MFDVYLLSSRPFGALHVGVTADLVTRVSERKVKAVPRFTSEYGADRLVRYEQHTLLEAAFAGERQIKKWKRAWKIQLIAADNPQWIARHPSIAL